MSKLRERTNKVVWGVHFHGIEPSDALDQILTAVEEGIKNCRSCWGLGWVGSFSHQVQCKECGGKGWVMK